MWTGTLRFGELRDDERVNVGCMRLGGLSRRLPWLLMLLKVCRAVMLERLKGLSGAVASDLYSAVYACASTMIRTVSPHSCLEA